MNNKEVVQNWLRIEAEEMGIKIEKIDKSIIKTMKGLNISPIDRLNQLNITRDKFLAQQSKLYEMIGKIDRELKFSESEGN